MMKGCINPVVRHSAWKSFFPKLFHAWSDEQSHKVPIAGAQVISAGIPGRLRAQDSSLAPVPMNAPADAEGFHRLLSRDRKECPESQSAEHEIVEIQRRLVGQNRNQLLFLRAVPIPVEP